MGLCGTDYDCMECGDRQVCDIWFESVGLDVKEDAKDEERTRKEEQDGQEGIRHP